MKRRLEEFSTPIYSGLEPIDDKAEMRLDREVQRALNERLDELDRHRAQARIDGQNYLIR